MSQSPRAETYIIEAPFKKSSSLTMKLLTNIDSSESSKETAAQQTVDQDRKSHNSDRAASTGFQQSFIIKLK